MSLGRRVDTATNFFAMKPKEYGKHTLYPKLVGRADKKFLQQENITMQQYNILRILGECEKAWQVLCKSGERMLDRMSDTSRVVDRMILKALVEKKKAQ